MNDKQIAKAGRSLTDIVLVSMSRADGSITDEERVVMIDQAGALLTQLLVDVNRAATALESIAGSPRVR